MKSNNIVLEKSYRFALRTIELYQILANRRKEFVLSKQLLKSGTSIGANAEEAIGAQSKKDFKAKLSISYKEARETHYWLRLLNDSGLISNEIASYMLEDCEELLKIIGSILKTINNS